ncbi:hypothetical protein Q9189_003055 [Teloschistes chrysophthalmus]
MNGTHPSQQGQSISHQQDSSHGAAGRPAKRDFQIWSDDDDKLLDFLLENRRVRCYSTIAICTPDVSIELHGTQLTPLTSTQGQHLTLNQRVRVFENA